MIFAKYSGAGNDFVVTEADWDDETGAAVARHVCPRSTGVGVDGLVLVRRVAPDRIRVRFFNPDGSAYGTCGNGSRCAAHFALLGGLVSADPFTIETSDAEIEARVLGDQVELEFHMPVRVADRIMVDGPAGRAEGWLVRIGVPHFVLPLARLPAGSIQETGARIRRDPALGPEGANVNLVSLESRQRGHLRTFERGVEGETAACGSGAMATAFALHEAGLCDSALDLSVRGGCDLHIRIADEARDGMSRLVLAGPVTRVFDGRFPVDRPGAA